MLVSTQSVYPSVFVRFIPLGVLPDKVIVVSAQSVYQNVFVMLHIPVLYTIVSKIQDE